MTIPPAPPPPWPLPCPVEAGWEVIADEVLPRLGSDGRPIGGFSAIAVDPAGGPVWLLSDAPEPYLVPLFGSADLGRRPPRTGARFPLRTASGAAWPGPLDGEGLVLHGDDLWVVSEGRRSADQPPLLLRFGRRDGRLRQRLELPPAWRPTPGAGLGSNQGPEALALLPAAGGGPAALLLAAERPLLQDPPERLRLLSFGPLTKAPAFRPAGVLAVDLQGPHWGLTDLLPFGAGTGLWGLVRGFEPPGRWWARLLQLPPPGAADPLVPRRQWDLLAAGLTPENWEGIAPGAPLSDGRPTLLLVSDDNFNPLQLSRIARIAPRQSAPCPAEATSPR